MKTATGLTLVAIGAILALAVTSQPSFINLHIAGFVIALTGAAGLLIPKRGYGWLRRRVVVRRGSRGQVSRVEDTAPPPYLALNPGAKGPVNGPEPGDIVMGDPANPIPVVSQKVETRTVETPVEETRTAVPAAEETIEEFIEE
jgi:hypothetical protein